MAKYVKTTGPHAFAKAWFGRKPDDLVEAFRKEASREVGEMERWMNDQIENDPVGMLWDYSERFFPLVKKAVKYRMRIYNRNRLVDAARFDLMQASASGDPVKIEEAKEAWSLIEDEQIALCVRIKRIHMFVTHQVRLEIDKDNGEVDPFEDYEYDPEKI